MCIRDSAYVVDRIEQVVEGLAAKGTVQIKVEHKLKVVAGDGAALEFDEVDVCLLYTSRCV